MKIIAYLFSSFLIFSSCKKEPDYIQPEECFHYVEEYEPEFKPSSDYICARPGSWWEYDNNLSLQECSINENAKVINHEKPNKCTIVTTTEMNLPRIGSEHFLGNKVITGIGKNEPSFTANYIDTVVGQLEYFDDYPDRSWYTVEGKYDSLEVNGTWFFDIINTKIRHEQFTITHYSSQYRDMGSSEFFFAKNIGKIRIIYHPPYYMGGSEPDTFNLINYYIAPE